MEKLIKKLKTDNDIWISYKANIAMAFKDRCSQYKKETGKKSLSNEDIHIIANEAAESFLNLLCS